jgi:hypothetical protein
VPTLCCQSTRIQAQAIGWIYDPDPKTKWHTMQFSPRRQINTLQEATLQEMTQVYLKTNWTPLIDHHQDGQEQALPYITLICMWDPSWIEQISMQLKSRIAILQIQPFHHQHNLMIPHKFPMVPVSVLTAAFLQGLGSGLRFASKHIHLNFKATLNWSWSAGLIHPVPTICSLFPRDAKSFQNPLPHPLQTWVTRLTWKRWIPYPT